MREPARVDTEARAKVRAFLTTALPYLSNEGSKQAGANGLEHLFHLVRAGTNFAPTPAQPNFREYVIVAAKDAVDRLRRSDSGPDPSDLYHRNRYIAWAVAIALETMGGYAADAMKKIQPGHVEAAYSIVTEELCALGICLSESSVKLACRKNNFVWGKPRKSRKKRKQKQ